MYWLYNWQYPFLLPSDEEIKEAYESLNGKEAHASDADSDGSASSDGESNSDESDADEELEDV